MKECEGVLAHSDTRLNLLSNGESRLIAPFEAFTGGKLPFVKLINRMGLFFNALGRSSHFLKYPEGQIIIHQNFKSSEKIFVDSEFRQNVHYSFKRRIMAPFEFKQFPKLQDMHLVEFRKIIKN